MPTSVGSYKKQENSRKTSTSSSLTTRKALTLDPTNYGKFLKKWEYQTTLPVSWETYMRVKKQELEPDMKQRTGSKLGKEYHKVVYWHPEFHMSTSCEMPIWMNPKLAWDWNQDCWGKYQQPLICRWYHSKGRKWRRAKEPLDECERGEWKS